MVKLVSVGKVELNWGIEVLNRNVEVGIVKLVMVGIEELICGNEVVKFIGRIVTVVNVGNVPLGGGEGSDVTIVGVDGVVIVPKDVKFGDVGKDV